MQHADVDTDPVADATHGGPTHTTDETEFIQALRAGNELAFVALIDRYQPGMFRLARVFVRDVSIAEEVVQEAWLAVLRGLHRFEARSSLKWWISSILVNGAKTRATRERRTIPFSAVWDPGWRHVLSCRSRRSISAYSCTAAAPQSAARWSCTSPACERDAMTHSHSNDLSCKELVELVTEY